MTRLSTGRHWLLALAVAASTVACEDATPIAPVIPPTLTETFSSPLEKNGAVSHPFFVNARGAVTATLIAVTPDAAIAVGFSLGTWNGVSCAAVISNDKALQGVNILGTVNAPGTLCVRMYDIGMLTEPISYEVRVEHY